MSEVPPALLEERRRLGLDLFDEMWEGVLHMNPPPLGDHQGLSSELFLVLGVVAKGCGLEPRMETGYYAAPDDWRVPDHAYARAQHLIREGMSRAELVIEFRSPHHETYEKLPWYARHGASEILVIHPPSRAVELYFVIDGRPELVHPGPEGAVQLKSLGDTRLETVTTPSGLRLRVTAPDGTTTDV